MCISDRFFSPPFLEIRKWGGSGQDLPSVRINFYVFYCFLVFVVFLLFFVCHAVLIEYVAPWRFLAITRNESASLSLSAGRGDQHAQKQ